MKINRLVKSVTLFLALLPLCHQAGAEPLRKSIEKLEYTKSKINELTSPEYDCADNGAGNQHGFLAPHFSPPEFIPAPIKAAGQSVRRLCYGRADSAEACITVFAIGGGRFVTNAHTLEGLDEKRKFCSEFAKEAPEDCPNSGGFFATGTAGDAKSVQPRVLARGKYDPQLDVQLTQNKDLAILCIEGLENVPAIKAAGKTKVKMGASVHALGFPSLAPGGVGDFSSMTAPVASHAGITAVTQERGVVASALLLNGMSGGPLLDDDGNLVGVARAGSKELERLLDPEAPDFEKNIALYQKGLLRLKNPQASGFIPRAALNAFVDQSPCKSCNAKCTKPL